MPEPMKRLTLQHYADHYSLKTFIETGTFRGETLAFLEAQMEELHSVELSPELFAAAQKNFEGNAKIHLHHGDSADIFPKILNGLRNSALIWLDAHYSAKITAHGPEETPILAELDAVFSNKNHRHLILIDDAREFEGNPAYPKLQQVREMAEKNGYFFECRFDLIRLLPT
jgi:predicted O-methyltransferase YrrM